MKKCCSNRGSAILEQVFAAAILAVGALALGMYLSSSNQSTVRLRGYSSEDKVLETVRSAALMPSAIRNSYVGGTNATLDNCLTQNPSFLVANPSHQDCPTGTPVPFVLYGPLVSSGLGVTAGAVTGTKSNPMFYDLTGQSCTTTSAANAQTSSMNCAIQAWTELVPQCPSQVLLGPPAPNCDVAETIQINYHIEPVPNAGGSSNVTPISGSISLSVMQISGEPPSINTVLPVPSPLPNPTPSGSPAPGPTPPVPTVIHCPGNTFQWGNSCACPPGDSLMDPINAICAHVGI